MLLSAIPTILLRNLVVATDFSPASELALGYAHAVAQHYGSKLTLVHAITHAEEDKGRGHPLAEVVDAAEANLRIEAAKCADVECHTRLIRGTALEVVDEILAMEQVDLIVVGTHGTHGLRRLLEGSAAEQIFRHVHCPVLVIGPAVLKAAEDWKPAKILLTTDLESDESRTVEYAMAFAAEHHAELALLHVTAPGGVPFPEDTEEFLTPYFQSRLQRLMPSWAGVPHPHFWVEFSHDPVAEITRVMDEHKIELLVLSVHPKSPWATHFHHDAQRLMSQAPCPVLVVQRRF